MEILVFTAIKHIESVQRVVRSVTVNDIEQDGDSHSVCRVDQSREFFGSTVTRRNREEGSDLVSERGVVSVFHDCPAHKNQVRTRRGTRRGTKKESVHELDRVVTQGLDARENVSRELVVRSNLGLRARDTN